MGGDARARVQVRTEEEFRRWLRRAEELKRKKEQRTGTATTRSAP
jgi:hypothetical protein